MAEFSVFQLDDILTDIGNEMRARIARIRHRLVDYERAYFEQVRQRMPALTGNAVSAVSFSLAEGTNQITITIRQAESGATGEQINPYMPQGILGKSPHTSGHSVREIRKASAIAGRVVINPSAAQDPWLQAALDLGFTNFQRHGSQPTIITFDIPQLSQ